jgi:hypothetical protein
MYKMSEEETSHCELVGLYGTSGQSPKWVLGCLGLIFILFIIPRVSSATPWYCTCYQQEDGVKQTECNSTLTNCRSSVEKLALTSTTLITYKCMETIGDHPGDHSHLNKAFWRSSKDQKRYSTLYGCSATPHINPLSIPTAKHPSPYLLSRSKNTLKLYQLSNNDVDQIWSYTHPVTVMKFGYHKRSIYLIDKAWNLIQWPWMNRVDQVQSHSQSNLLQTNKLRLNPPLLDEYELNNGPDKQDQKIGSFVDMATISENKQNTAIDIIKYITPSLHPTYPCLQQKFSYQGELTGDYDTICMNSIKQVVNSKALQAYQEKQIQYFTESNLNIKELLGINLLVDFQNKCISEPPSNYEDLNKCFKTLTTHLQLKNKFPSEVSKYIHELIKNVDIYSINAMKVSKWIIELSPSVQVHMWMIYEQIRDCEESGPITTIHSYLVTKKQSSLVSTVTSSSEPSLDLIQEIVTLPKLEWAIDRKFFRIGSTLISPIYKSIFEGDFILLFL